MRSRLRLPRRSSVREGNYSRAEEAEPPRHCVPKAEPGNENNAASHADTNERCLAVSRGHTPEERGLRITIGNTNRVLKRALVYEWLKDWTCIHHVRPWKPTLFPHKLGDLTDSS